MLLYYKLRLEPVMVSRAAVVLGVNKTGGLTPLRAAVSGARQVEAWLAGEGFDVTCLVDEPEPLKIEHVKAAVRDYVNRGTLEQLVIYFAGHGYLNGTSETWLLSHSPDDPNEAIGQTESAELARSCGIRSIVFISDACRSNPPTLVAARVTGSSIFPNRQDNHVEVEVDRFFAAKPGDPALELTLEEAGTLYAGLFTEMLRRVHRDPDQSLTRNVKVDGADTIVVPCRRLKEVLPERVNEAAQERSILLKQKPQLRLESGENTFIGRAQFTAPPMARGNRGTDFSFRRDRLTRPRTGWWSYQRLPQTSVDTSAPAPVARETQYADFAYSSELFSTMGGEFDEAADRLLEADSTGHFETGAGIQVTGADVEWAYGVGVYAEVVPTHAPSLVRLHTEVRRGVAKMHGSVLVQFADGSGTILAGLPGYIAAVTVENGGVVNVSYVPSTNSQLWEEYQYDRERVERLRAVAAAAARKGVLAVDREDAKRFGDIVRQAKRWDPTLGLYAVLAYAEFGLKADAQSVQVYMLRDLGVDLFDVALLAGRLAPEGLGAVPFCPMLSQSWSFLGPRGVQLPPILAKASRRRLPTLWTTFDRDGMALLRRSAERGALP